MKIKDNAFQGDVMKSFNGCAVSPAMLDNIQVKGLTGTLMYYLVKDGKVSQTRALFLNTSQISD